MAMPVTQAMVVVWCNDGIPTCSAATVSGSSGWSRRRMHTGDLQPTDEARYIQWSPHATAVMHRVDLLGLPYP